MKKIEAIAEEIRALGPSERLRCAADLLDAAADRNDSLALIKMAHRLVKQTSTELGALLCMRRMER